MSVSEVSPMPGRRRYHVVLTGELMPGHTVEAVLPAMSRLFATPAADLRQLFHGGQHPIDRQFSGDEALEMQERLEQIGVRARVERIPERAVNLVLRHEAGQGATIERLADREGLEKHDPGDYDGQREATGSQAQAAPVGQDRHSPTHAEMRWRQAWADMEVDAGPEEPDRQALFVGPSNPYYLPLFERFRGARSPAALISWNWAAVLSPFLWALYRKLWPWALVIGFTEVVLPVLLLFMGLNGIVSDKLVYVAYLGWLANRLFWPVVLNYLYFRHVEGMLMRIHGMAPYVADGDVAGTGGVSMSAVFVGLAFSGVLTLFVWSFIDSMQEPGLQQLENRLATLPDQRDLVGLREREQEGIESNTASKEENSWVQTRSKLRTLGQAVNQWMMVKSASGGQEQLNLFRLREDMDLSQDALLDGWGNSVQYIPDNEGYRLISAGPDKLFGTADDIQYRRVLNR